MFGIHVLFFSIGVGSMVSSLSNANAFFLSDDKLFDRALALIDPKKKGRKEEEERMFNLVPDLSRIYCGGVIEC